MGCEATEIKKSGESRIGRPDAESWQATITLTNEGAKRAVIRSGHLEKYNERQYILLDQNVDADFFNAEEVYTTNLKSKMAKIDEEEDFLIAIGDVVVVVDQARDGQIVETLIQVDGIEEKLFQVHRRTLLQALHQLLQVLVTLLQTRLLDRAA